MSHLQRWMSNSGVLAAAVLRDAAKAPETAAQALCVAAASPRSAQDAATVMPFERMRMHTDACRVLDGWDWRFPVPDTETVHTAGFGCNAARSPPVQRRPARHVSTPIGVTAGWDSAIAHAAEGELVAAPSSTQQLPIGILLQTQQVRCKYENVPTASRSHCCTHSLYVLPVHAAVQVRCCLAWSGHEWTLQANPHATGVDAGTAPHRHCALSVSTRIMRMFGQSGAKHLGAV